MSGTWPARLARAWSGVVHGFTTTLKGGKLRVGPGLAIDPRGRPLRSDAEAVLTLADPPVLDSSGNGFLVVEVGPAEWASGHEKVYGEVCGDGCAGSGSSIQPWIGEGITVELVPRSIEGLGTAGMAQRRNRLASLFFQQERAGGEHWLDLKAGPMAFPITGWDWNAGAPDAPPARVPIAALLAVDGKWVLDVWTARRDIDGPPAKNVWQSRLSMRPWNIFMAQVPQFQAQLVSRAAELEQWDFNDDDLEALKRLETMQLNRVQSKVVGPGYSDWLKRLEKVVQPLALNSGHVLGGMGFEDLPPAGYLPIPQAGKGVRAAVQQLLGSRLDYRFVSASADYVARAVDESQHRDRIPLAGTKPWPELDILIPKPAAGGLALGWVAFVHRSCCDAKEAAPETEPVGVYIAHVHRGAEKPNQHNVPGLRDQGKWVAELKYPHRDWAYPADNPAVLAAFTTFVAALGEKGISFDVYLVGLAAEDKLPLIAVRASLPGASLDSGLTAPVYSVSQDANKQEAIIIVIEPKDEEN